LKAIEGSNIIQEICDGIGISVDNSRRCKNVKKCVVQQHIECVLSLSFMVFHLQLDITGLETGSLQLVN